MNTTSGESHSQHFVSQRSQILNPRLTGENTRILNRPTFDIQVYTQVPSEV